MTHENLMSILNLGLGLGLSWQLDILDIVKPRPQTPKPQNQKTQNQGALG